MNEERMCKKPVITDGIETLKLERILLNSLTFKENWIQELLEKEPHILPTGSIDSIFAPLVFIAREVETPSGFIDNLYISAKGYLVVVETKLWRNPEARREVVGQIIDYAKDVKEWNYEKIEAIYQKYNNTNKTLFSKLIELGYQKEESESSFIDIVEKNILNARFLLMIVGDGIREGVERMADFLNNTPNMQYRLALCELEVYDLGSGKRLVIPQLTTKTKVIERGIIRIEEGTKNIIEVTMTEEPKEQKRERGNSTWKPSVMSFDEFFDKLNSENTNINKDSLSDLLNDLEDLGFAYHIGSSECVISYTVPTTQIKIPVFRINVVNKCWFVPSDIYSRLEKLGYSKSLGESLVESLRKYLEEKQKTPPYEKDNAFYYISVDTIIDSKDEILSILEDFKSNF